MKNMRDNISVRKFCLIILALCTFGIGQMWCGSYRIYLKPTGIWNGGGAKFSIHYWNTSTSSSEDQWMTPDGDYYYYDVPDWANKLIFIRNTNTASNPGFDNYWAKTNDLDCPYSRLYEITSYGSGNPATSGGTWKNIWLGARTVYIDANNLGWDKTISSGPYLRIGRNSTDAGSTSAYQMTKVNNTSNLYKHYQASDWSNYTCYCITNAMGYTNDKSVYDTHNLSFSTARNEVSVVTDITIIPKYPAEANGYEYGGNYIDRYDNHLYNEGLLKYNLTLSKTGSGSVTIYAPVNGSTDNMHSFVDENGYTVPTGNIRIEVTPADGYELTSLTAGEATLRNDEGYGYTFYYNNVTSSMTISATFSAITEKKIYIYDSGNWRNARGKLFIHAWNTTMSTDNGYGNYGPEMTSLGNGWFEATLSTAFTHFMISDSTDAHKSSNCAVADYVDGGCYSTANNNIPSYSATEPPIVYVEVTKDGNKYLSNSVTSIDDTLSFFFPSGGTAKLYYYSSGLQSVTLTTDFTLVKDNVITATWNGNKTASALNNLAIYTGDYHINVYATTANYLINGEGQTKFTKFEKNTTLFGDTYDYYWVDWFAGSQSVVATVGNRFNNDLAGVIAADANAPGGRTTGSGGNVRFGYDPTTNYFVRAIVTGAGSDIKIKADASGKIIIGGNDAYTNPQSFNDATNWVYTVDATVKGQSTASVQTTYNGNQQILLESKQLINGVIGTDYNVTLSYDFKTNRVIAAWTPSTVTESFSLQSNLMIERTEDGAPAILNITSEGTKVSDITQIYTVLKFTKDSWDANSNSSHRIVTGIYTDEYYWLSLPYDCNVSDIFGIEGYGDSWVIQTYHGDYRAEKGWWAETENWWYNLGREDVMKANQGYVLRVTNLGSVFPSGDHTVLRLYFPSAKTDLSIGRVQGSDTTTTVPEHKCTHVRDSVNHAGDPNYDRRVIDSNWNIIGSPSFNTAKITDTGWATSLPDTTGGHYEDYKPKPTPLKYFYTWDVDDNKGRYTIKAGDAVNSFAFQATHAYLVQYAGTITWEKFDNSNPLVGIKKAPAQVNEEQSGEQTLRLVLNKDGKQADAAYISRMAEGATEGYDLNLDLSKLMSKSGDNLYTFAGYYKMAGNCLPDTVSSVPVGVQLAHSGEYTFALPDGSNGIGAVLVDKATDTRTNIGLTDYTVALEAGTYNNRFSLELSPMSPTPTDVKEITDDGSLVEGARKVLMDGTLYIVRDGKVYDARGTRIQ